MCGVDHMDQLMSYYSPLRKTLKWYRKVVLQHLDMAVVNAYILYKKLGGSRKQLEFRKCVIASLISLDTTREEKLPVSQTSKAFFHHKTSDLARLSGQHYLGYISPTASKQNPTRKYVVCNRKGQRKETRYLCKTCSSLL